MKISLRFSWIFHEIFKLPSCFPLPALKSPFLQEALVPLIGEGYLETEIWVLDVLFAAGGITVSRHSELKDVGNI